MAKKTKLELLVVGHPPLVAAKEAIDFVIYHCVDEVSEASSPTNLIEALVLAKRKIEQLMAAEC